MKNFYNASSLFTVPAITTLVANMPKVTFADITVGEHFMRTNKKGDGQVFLKIGKRNAILLLDAKGRCDKVLKFKQEARVIPLNSSIELSYATLTEAGRIEADRRLANVAHVDALKVPRQQKPMRRIMESIANSIAISATAATIATVSQHQQPVASDAYTS